MSPDFFEFWDLVLNPTFLITMGLVLAAFLPLLFSVLLTWEASIEEEQQQDLSTG